LQDPFDSEPFSIEAIGVDVVKVWSKSDLRNAGIEPRDHELAISVRSGKGFDSLTKRILESIASKTGSASASMPTRRRQVDLLLNTERFLLKALESRDIGLELTAEHLRQAAHALGKLTGRVDVEDLLDVIFSEFCIGK
jgi:tRNA modification GTPase